MSGCLNCQIYRWEEGRVVSHVQESLRMRCQKCKMMYYCGRDCQVEHWFKSHKEKCKYYRGDKEQKAGVHRHLTSACNGCKEEQDMKEGQWGCHMQKRLDFWDNPIRYFPGPNAAAEKHEAPFAAELGELTGNYSSRLEHVASVLQKILHKMDLNGHALSRKKQFINLTKMVFKLRFYLLGLPAIIPSGMIDNYNHDSLCRVLILPIILELSDNYEDDVNDVYRLWDTFILIYECFFVTKRYLLKGFEDGGFKMKDKTIKVLLGQVEKSVKMEEKWDKLGSVLSSGPVPYLTILEIVIGSLTMKCSSCKDEIIIKSTHLEYFSVVSGREKIPNLMSDGILFRFYCGKLNCKSEVVDTLRKDSYIMSLFILKFIEDHIDNRCDWCFTFKRTVHRCRRCLTKVYCCEECANNDWWKVHKEVCKEKPDDWKKKGKMLM